ncbi:MAG: response regulator [Candidatus Cloacimonetes bacterium]|nr:response regulator [Candidatus Cloacimonadota bacterium]
MFKKCRKDKALDILQRLAGETHRLDIRIGLSNTESVLLAVDDKHIVLAEFDPQKHNALLFEFPKIKVSTEELCGFCLLKHSFKTELVGQINWNDSAAYRFEMPKTITTNQEPFVINPDPIDNITLTFQLKDIQQFKKVESISATEIRFRGSFARYRELFGTTIYNIELKSPFDRIKLSAVFKHLKGNLFAFTDFFTDDDISEALRHYALSEFLRSRLLEEKFEHGSLHPNEAAGREEAKQNRKAKKKGTPDSKCILLVDDKKVITDIVGELLRTRTDYKVIATNDSIDTLNLAVENEPDAILLDLNMPGMDGISVARKLRQNRLTNHIPIIFMTASHDSRRVNEARELGVSSYLLKPVVFDKLLQVLQMVLAENDGLTKLMQTRVALLCDEADYSSQLVKEMRSRHIEVDCFKYPEELLRRNDTENFGLIIMRYTGKQAASLSIINTLRRKPVFKKTPIVMFPRTRSETNLCRDLGDEKLFFVENQIEPAAFTANLGSYFS